MNKIPRLILHIVKGNISSTFGLGYWLKYPCKITGLSLVIGKHEFSIGDCMTYKHLAEMISEPLE